MKCAYCDTVMPDGAEACPECGKPVDKTGLGGTLKFFDMKSNALSTGIIYIVVAAVLVPGVIWECRSFFGFGFALRRLHLIDIMALAAFATCMFSVVIGIIHIKNAGRFYFSIKNHGVKAVYPTYFGTPKYLECKYEDISYAYIAKAGKHSALKIGTPESEHKISGLNVLDEQYINSQINSAVSTPDDE